MALTARQTHIIAQRRHPVAYWALGGVVVASIGLAVIDQRLGLVPMMLVFAISSVFRRWASEVR